MLFSKTQPAKVTDEKHLEPATTKDEESTFAPVVLTAEDEKDILRKIDMQ